MRSGLYREVPSPADELLSRVQKNVKDAVETLAADHDVLSVPITTYVVTGAIQAGKSIVAFRGNTGQTLTMPQAKAQGSNVSAVLLVLNTSANAVTLKPTAGDTINGALSLSLAAGAVTSLTSDGVTKWLAPVSGGGGVTDGDKGDVVVSVGGTVWLIDAAYTAAVLAAAALAAPHVTSATLALGATAKPVHVINVVDASVSGASKIQVSWGATLDTDENGPDMDDVSFAARPAAGSFNVVVAVATGAIAGNLKINYLVAA